MRVILAAMMIVGLIGVPTAMADSAVQNIVNTVSHIPTETLGNVLSTQSDLQTAATNGINPSDPEGTLGNVTTDPLGRVDALTLIITAHFNNQTVILLNGSTAARENASAIVASVDAFAAVNTGGTFAANTITTGTRTACNQPGNVLPSTNPINGTNSIDTSAGNYTNTPSNLTRAPNCGTASVGGQARAFVAPIVDHYYGGACPTIQNNRVKIEDALAYHPDAADQVPCPLPPSVPTGP